MICVIDIVASRCLLTTCVSVDLFFFSFSTLQRYGESHRAPRVSLYISDHARIDHHKPVWLKIDESSRKLMGVAE